jgi:hypothetical protein
MLWFPPPAVGQTLGWVGPWCLGRICRNFIFNHVSNKVVNIIFPHGLFYTEI